MQRILGIDPGSSVTGYGVIEHRERQIQYLTSGCIRLKDKDMAVRLGLIFAGIMELIDAYQPSILAIEAVFVARNAASALKLGQARGAAMCAAVKGGLEVVEYAPRTIKQAVTGSGAASKEQVQHMICRLLDLTHPPALDASDALAIALCHAHTHATLQHIAALPKGIRLGRSRR